MKKYPSFESYSITLAENSLKDPCSALGALGKIKFLVPFRVVRAQVPPSGDETGHQNYIGIPPIGGRTIKVIPASWECTRSAMVNTNPQTHWK
ncbi:hypothetical protein TNCV_55751 [Trichonephila clavipes]|nr:hypothetical protein TNCV_55751 [Trichonephila clavipes]